MFDKCTQVGSFKEMCKLCQEKAQNQPLITAAMPATSATPQWPSMFTTVPTECTSPVLIPQKSQFYICRHSRCISSNSAVEFCVYHEEGQSRSTGNQFDKGEASEAKDSAHIIQFAVQKLEKKKAVKTTKESKRFTMNEKKCIIDDVKGIGGKKKNYVFIGSL